MAECNLYQHGRYLFANPAPRLGKRHDQPNYVGRLGREERNMLELIIILSALAMLCVALPVFCVLAYWRN